MLQHGLYSTNGIPGAPWQRSPDFQHTPGDEGWVGALRGMQRMPQSPAGAGAHMCVVPQHGRYGTLGYPGAPAQRWPAA
jgi:hypothetical protein